MGSGEVPGNRPFRRLWLLAAVFAFVGFVVAGGVPCGLLTAQPACSVVISPGPTTDVLPAVTVTGVETFEPARGSALNMATIAVAERVTWRGYLAGLRSQSDDVAPRTAVFPKDETRFDTQARNNASMRSSQLAAEQAAFGVLNENVVPAPVGVEITAHTSTSLLTELPVGTVINQLNDVPIVNVDGFQRRLAAQADGTQVTIGTTDGRQVTVILTGDTTQQILGAHVADVVSLPFSVTVDAGVVGGPSAGLLFGIAIIERLTQQQLIPGLVVSATGTLQANGTVGPVGGIRQKLFAAGTRESAVEVFLLPQANVSELSRATVERDLVVVP
ncbi:MAG: S16 family serine protease, partial [Nitriliruptoraceae bacterium]